MLTHRTHVDPLLIEIQQGFFLWGFKSIMKSIQRSRRLQELKGQTRPTDIKTKLKRCFSSLSLSLHRGPTSDIKADLKPLTGAAPISLVYIYVCLGLTDTRRSYWLKWEPFGLEQHQWIIRVSSSNLEGPRVLEMNQARSLPNHLVLGSKNHIFL